MLTSNKIQFTIPTIVEVMRRNINQKEWAVGSNQWAILFVGTTSHRSSVVRFVVFTLREKAINW